MKETIAELKRVIDLQLSFHSSLFSIFKPKLDYDILFTLKALITKLEKELKEQGSEPLKKDIWR